MAQVAWTERARDDLREIRDFIARDSLVAADSLVDRLIAGADSLATLPESGRRLPEFPRSGYRELIVSSYRLLYRVERETVWVAGVLHGRRLLRQPPTD